MSGSINGQLADNGGRLAINPGNVQYYERGTLVAVAGTNQKDLTPVPAGKVYQITNIAARDQNTAAASVIIFATNGSGVQTFVNTVAATPAGAWVPSPALNFFMFPGWFIRVIWTGCALNDNLFVDASGLKFDL